MTKSIIGFLLFLPLTIFSQFSEAEFVHTTFGVTFNDMALGDIDNDGLVDMVFLTNNHISWSKKINNQGIWSTNKWLNQEARRFRKIKLTDVDGDNLLDIVVIIEEDFVEGYDTSIEWYKNQGEGNFSDAILIESIDDNLIGGRTFSLDVGDIDNDGDQDIVASFRMADEDQSKIAFYDNSNGLGGFSIENIDESIQYPSLLQLAHLNDDEYLDLLVLDDGDAIVIHENLAGNGFALPSTVATSSISLISLTTGDLDGDGDSDIIAGTNFTTEIVWYENQNNDNSFNTEELIYEGAANSRSIIAIDLDGDGDLEIVYLASSDFELGILENDGSGNFSDPTLVYTEFGFSSDSFIYAEDIDGDNDLDLIAGGDSDEDFFIFSNEGQINFSLEQRLNMSQGFASNQLQFVDIDNDGFKDILTIQGSSSGPLIWYRYNPEFELFEKYNSIDISPLTAGSQLRVFDINNDGFKDILLANNSNLNWLFNTGDGNFSTVNSIDIPIGLQNFYVADLNNDGLEDVVSSIEFGAIDGIFWCENLGDSFDTSEYLYNAPDRVTSIEIVDFDGNGSIDLIPILNNGSSIGWLANDNGIFAPWASLLESLGPYRDVLAIDLNDDGFKDILTTSGWGIRLYEATSLTTFNSPEVIISLVEEFFTQFDFDNDGIEDIIYIGSDDKPHWLKRIDSLEYFGEATLIDFGVETEDMELFSFQDADDDGDKDLIFGSSEIVYRKDNLGPLTTSLSTLNPNGNLTIFPNPTSGDFSIKFSEPILGKVELRITNLAGKNIYKNNLHDVSNGNIIHLNQLNLMPGLYFIEVSYNSKSWYGKLLFYR